MLDRFDERARQAPSSTDTELYRALVRERRRQWPTVRVAAAQFEAGTDAVPWRERDIPVYGVYPYPVSRAELADMHGNDERISIRRLEEGHRHDHARPPGRRRARLSRRTGRARWW